MSGVPNAGNIPATVKNSDDSYDTTVLPGNTLTLPDSLITKSDLTDLYTLPATGTYAVPDSVVENSDASYSANVKATEPLVLDDMTLTEPDGTTSNHPSKKNISAIQIAALDSQALNDQLTIAQRNSFDRVKITQTGQTVSYAGGDDGALQKGRLTNFTTLKKNNVFGNTNRFTDENGLQVYGSNYIIDHATDLGWYRLPYAAVTWANALTAIAGVTILGHNDFRLPNLNEINSIVNIFYESSLNYVPFNIGEGIFNTSSTCGPTNSTKIFGLASSRNMSSTALIIVKTKTDLVQYIICRTHY